VFATDVVTENTTLYAKWTINQYTLTFDSAGGSAMAPITQDYGTAVVAPAAPTRTGYTFVGWSPAVPATMPAENRTLTAQWTLNTYTVMFSSQGGSAVGPIQANYGTTITAPTAPDRTGYSFVGWYRDLGYTTPWVFATDVVTGNTTLYARWTINQYTVTFRNWDGSLLKTELVNYGGSATPPANPSRTGYTFAGWVPAYTNITNNLAVSAAFTINTYTVSFNSQGGSAVTSVQADYNTLVSSPAAPTRSGYIFEGWFKESAGTNPWTFGTDRVTGNTTLYARWRTAVPATMSSSTYSCNATSGFLSKVSESTVVATLLDRINEEIYIKVYKNNVQVSGSSLVGTGMVLRLQDLDGTTKQSLTAVVTGDINGDGRITLTDFVQMKAHLLKKTLLSGAFLKAADVNGDGNVTLTDFVRLRSHLLGKDAIVPQAY